MNESPLSEIMRALEGIDKTETESSEGWWETSAGAEFGAETLREISQAVSRLEALVESVKAVRRSDCGAWLKDCTTVLFTCQEGKSKRLELSKLLNEVYRSAGL